MGLNRSGVGSRKIPAADVSSERRHQDCSAHATLSRQGRLALVWIEAGEDEFVARNIAPDTQQPFMLPGGVGHRTCLDKSRIGV